MPNFQDWRPPAARFSPTPPAYQSTYQTPVNMMREKGYFKGYAGQGQTGCDFIERYSQGSAYASQRSARMSAHPRLSYLQSSHGFQDHSSYLSHMPVPYHHAGPPTGPTLAPIRAPDRAFDSALSDYPGRDAHVQLPAKPRDDVPSGGVAAHLDYEIDVMAEFVAEMVQGIVSPESRPSSYFYKYVAQILSSTRLPSSTIILGLFYLASRMRMVPDSGPDTHCSTTVCRMLTTCLLLGSKFLDDNTFQNRSWADVSNIPVADLNQMELEWLKGFDWLLHGPMLQDKEGFYAWRDHWKTYEKDAQLAETGRSQKLAPLDTSVACAPPSGHHPLMSPEGPIPLQYQRPLHYDPPWVPASSTDYSPSSASHSDPTTPDYYSSGSWSQAPPPYSRQAWLGHHVFNYPLHRPQPPSYPHTPSGLQGYPSSGWESHRALPTSGLCGQYSGLCLSHSAAYGIQPVVG